MGSPMSWLEKRRRVRADIARVFSARTSISEADFLLIFYDPDVPPPISDFNNQYVASSDLLDEIYSELGGAIGLEPEKVKAHYHRKESFAQFGEHLLQAGAYG
jgi:hypothetical protein